MPNLRCFSIGGMENQHDSILEPFGAMEEMIISLTRLPSTTYSLLSPSLSFLKSLNFPLLLIPLNLRNYSTSNLDLAAKTLIFEKILSRFMI